MINVVQIETAELGLQSGPVPLSGRVENYPSFHGHRRHRRYKEIVEKIFSAPQTSHLSRRSQIVLLERSELPAPITITRSSSNSQGDFVLLA